MAFVNAQRNYVHVHVSTDLNTHRRALSLTKFARREILVTEIEILPSNKEDLLGRECIDDEYLILINKLCMLLQGFLPTSLQFNIYENG